MIKFFKKYEIWIFLVLGPIINVFFVEARIKGYMPTYIYNTGRFCVLLVLLVCILKITRGNQGIKNLFKPMANWKINPKWYILCFIYPLAAAIITLLVKGFYYDLDYSTLIVFKATTFRGFIALFVWAFLGEVVWVSYCIRELSKVMKPFYAGQLVALFWALWFVPIILLGEGVFPEIPVISLFIYMMGTAGMCALIYDKTKSGTCVLTLQYMLNLTLAALPITPTNGGAPTYTGFAVVYLIGMLSLTYILNRKKARQTSLEFQN